MTPTFSRRHALMAAAALPFAPALVGPAHAAADMKGMTVPTHNRFKLGAFEVTTLLAGTRTVEKPTEIFGLNTDPAEFQAVSEAAFLPTDKAQFFFTPTVVNTGTELVLFDTGLNPEGITAALAAAGYSPDQIDTVVITHMHGDHIGGVSTDGTPTFAKAKHITGAVEHNHWMGAANETFDGKIRPLNEAFTMIDDGASVASGITAMMAAGHTPGHMTYRIESEGQQLLIMADLANHYVWSLAHPDWEVRFDMDKSAAAASRRAVLGMLAADRVPMIGYHMPFPGMGFVETAGDGFRYVPTSYQMMMG